MYVSNIKNVSFWLCPAAEQNAPFKAVIDQASTQHNTHTFLPHVTVGSSEIMRARAQDVLSTAAHQGVITGTLTTPFYGDGSDISHTMGYMFSLSQSSDQNFLTVIKSLKDHGIATVVNKSEMHMSLLYKTGGVHDSDRDDLREASIAAGIENKPTTLDTLVAVEIERPFVDHKQVTSWSIIGKCNLNSSLESRSPSTPPLDQALRKKI